MYALNQGDGTFGPFLPIPGSNGATVVMTADIDGDGDEDVVSGSSLKWHRNRLTDGVYNNFDPTPYVFYGATPGDLAAGDIDRDGKVDIVATFPGDQSVRWFENDGLGSFTGFTINAFSVGSCTACVKGGFSVLAVDIDLDGDLDVIAGENVYDSSADIWVFENPLKNAGSPDGDPTTVPSTWIGVDNFYCSALSGSVALFAADFDRDGDPDLFATSSDDTGPDDKILWFKNPAPNGSPFAGWSCFTVSENVDGPNSVFGADLDGDGDVDILSASSGDSKVAWYENRFDEGQDSFLSQFVLSSSAIGASKVIAGDFNGDGDIDVISASQPTLYPNELIHRSALFPEQTVLSPNTGVTQPEAVVAADIDGDGDQDLLVGSYFYGSPGLGWLQNDGAGSFGSFNTIFFDNNAIGSYAVAAGDIDGDGDLDAVAGFYDLYYINGYHHGLFWFENDLAGVGVIKSDQNPVGADFFDVDSLVLADIDGDGNLDVVAGGYVYPTYNTSLQWFLNDGTGTFTPQTEIASNNSYNFDSVAAGDVDGDGDVDVVAASKYYGILPGAIVWFENNGVGVFNPVANPILASGYFGYAYSVSLADIDGDGDLDALSSYTYAGNIVAWHENTGGGVFNLVPNVIGNLPYASHSVFASDLDIDGDLDVLVADTGAGLTIFSFENLDGGGTFGTAQTVSVDVNNATAVIAADLDRDGDPDVVSTSRNDDKIAWYENKGGQFALETTDTAPSTLFEGTVDDLLAIEMFHRGRTGDFPETPASFELRFDGAVKITSGEEQPEKTHARPDDTGSESIPPPMPLDAAELDALFREIRIYHDADANEMFDLGADTLVGTISDFSNSTGGEVSIPVQEDNVNTIVPFGDTKTFFVASLLEGDAFDTFDRFQVTHLTESTSTGRDADKDVPISLEFADDTTSSEVIVADLPNIFFVRELPQTYTPGDEFRVSIFVFGAPAGTVYNVVEDVPTFPTVPSSWTVTNISDGGTESNGRITWAGLSGNFSGSGLSYSVTPPPGESGERCFSGTGLSGVVATVGDDCVRAVIQRTFDQWAVLNGVALGNTGGDDDGDLDENLLEFAFATDPKNGSSIVAQRTLKVRDAGLSFPVGGGPGQITCQYNRSKTAKGITYNIKSTTALPFLPGDIATVLSDRKIGEGPGTILREVVVEVPAGAMEFFVQIEVTMP